MATRWSEPRGIRAAESKTLVALVAGIACAGTAGAQGVEFTPIIELTTTYTDNINLQPDVPPLFAEDEFVTQVNPAFTLRREEGRVTADVEYRMQNLFFARDSDRDTTFHQLSGVADAELIPENLFLGVDTTFVQSIIDATSTIPSSNVADTENLGDVWAASIGPMYTRDFGTAARLQADYTYSRLEYRDIDEEAGSVADDFDRNNASFSFASIPAPTGLSWGTRYSYDRVTYDNQPEWEFERADLELGVPVGEGLRFIVLGGLETDAEEDNRPLLDEDGNPILDPEGRLICAECDGGLDSSFWEAGIRWQAGRRNELEARYGNRFFGDTYFFEWQFQGRRLTASVTYNEDPSTVGLEQEGLSVPVITDPGESGPILITPGTGRFIDKEFAAAVEYSWARSSLGVDVRETTRETQFSSEDESDRQANLNWRWQLAPETELAIGAGWLEFEFRDGGGDTEQQRYTARLTRTVGARLAASLLLRHETQDSTGEGAGEYDENAVELALRWTFSGQRSR